MPQVGICAFNPTIWGQRRVAMDLRKPETHPGLNRKFQAS